MGRPEMGLPWPIGRWTPLSVLVLLACGGGSPPSKGTEPPEGEDSPPPGDSPAPTEECVSEHSLVVTVTGEAGGSPQGAAGLLDSASWRLGDAVPLTTVLSWDEAGRFRLCLTGEPALENLYEKAFLAAWIDLDADGRLDAQSEATCDRDAEGALLEELYYQDGVWRVGLDGPSGEALALDLVLDGDRCSR